MLQLRVPASIANLGPGFDVLGMAVSVFNMFTLEGADGWWEADLRMEHSENLILATAADAAAHFGRPISGMRVQQVEQIPRARGLGSSATARIAGLLGWAHLSGYPLSLQEALSFLTEREGHPDNVVAALCGGLTIAADTDNGLRTLSVPVPASLKIALCIPEVEVSTDAARKILPESLSRGDVVFQAQRLAMLLHGLLLGDAQSLLIGTEDRLHTPTRGPLIGPVATAFASARAAGGAPFISGSGSTLGAFCTHDPEEVAAALAAPFAQVGVPTRTLVVQPVASGAWTE